jgi:predicted Zn-dependent protease
MLLKKKSILLLMFIATLFFSGTVIHAESLIDRVSLGIEKEIGYLNYHRILAAHPAFKPPADQEGRLKRIFGRLTEASERRDEVDYSVTVIDDPTVNACSLPGGYVLVNSGMLEFTRSDDELAGVLAHEIAHIDRQHAMKAVLRSVGMSAMVGAILNQKMAGSQRKVLVERMAQFSMVLLELGFSREAEFEADRYGVQFMREAGYDKRQWLSFWKRYQGLEVERDSAFLRALSTHPPTAERIRRIDGL